MINEKTCEWLIDNADAPIRYRVARELFKDDKLAKKIESELLENEAVKTWLGNLSFKPVTRLQSRNMVHGSFDYCLENSMQKVVQLGLHGRLPQLVDAAGFHIDALKENSTGRLFRNSDNDLNTSYGYGGFNSVLTANMLCMADIQNEKITSYMLGSLDEMYDFVRLGDYDIYITEEERAELKGIPPNWIGTEYFIKPDLIKEHGFCFPYIHDIRALYKLYGIQGTETDKKINAVIDYISNDDFHSKVPIGYGILIAGKRIYHGMGWDPRYPGWFDVTEYLENTANHSAPNGSHTENQPSYVPKLLYPCFRCTTSKIN